MEIHECKLDYKFRLWWCLHNSNVTTALTILFVAILLSACGGYIPGRQGYWDARVKELCEKDGGVTVYERIRVSRADVNRGVLPMTADGKLGVALKQLAHANAPVYAEQEVTYLRESNPEVGRVEWVAKRSNDQVVVARWIVYGRFGGDIPGPRHPSSFRCPEQTKILSDLQKLFIVEEERK